MPFFQCGTQGPAQSTAARPNENSIRAGRLQRGAQQNRAGTYVKNNSVTWPLNLSFFMPPQKLDKTVHRIGLSQLPNCIRENCPSVSRPRPDNLKLSAAGQLEIIVAGGAKAHQARPHAFRRNGSVQWLSFQHDRRHTKFRRLQSPACVGVVNISMVSTKQTGPEVV